MFPDAEAMPAHDPVTVIVKLLLLFFVLFVYFIYFFNKLGLVVMHSFYGFLFFLKFLFVHRLVQMFYIRGVILKHIVT